MTSKGLLYSHNQFQFGISYIAALLKKHGHRTSLALLNTMFRLHDGKNIEIVKKHIKNRRPDLICFSAVTSQYDFIAKLANNIKKAFPEIYLLAGGPHVSLNPQEAIRDAFDAICIGEGEYPTLELVNALSSGNRPTQIQNLWFQNGGVVEKNNTRPFLDDLDSLPFPDRDLWTEWMLDPNPTEGVVLLLGRGCPYNCGYCSNHALKKLAGGTYVRFRSPANIVQEIRELKVRFPQLEELYLEVETIMANEDWTLELCRALEDFNRTQDRPVAFGVNYQIMPRSNQARILEALKKSNFRYIKIGLESGSERVRSKILHRHYSNQDVIDLVHLARKQGLKIYFYNLIGIPGETYDDFQETIRMNQICQPEGHHTSIFCPYPETDFFNQCRDQGLLGEGFDFRQERQKSRLDLPGFSKKQIQHGYLWFDYKSYAGYKNRLSLLNTVAYRFAATSPFWYIIYALLYPLKEVIRFCILNFSRKQKRQAPPDKELPA